MSEASMIEQVKDALFDALEQHLMDADGLALQGGRFFISGADAHIDARVLARAAIRGDAGADQGDDALRLRDAGGLRALSQHVRGRLGGHDRRSVVRATRPHRRSARPRR